LDADILADARALAQARRILVIGSSGAGKSTLARALGQRIDRPLIHLDRAYFGPGWSEPGRLEWRSRVAALASGESWIMDGNYANSFDLRMPHADAVVWLDMPRTLCLRRVVWRVLKNWGRVRPDLADGCPEKFVWSFLVYVWNFPKMQRPQLIAALMRHGVHSRVIALSAPARVKALLAALDSLPAEFAAITRPEAADA
jgi:adenylate kinase family enzyme